MNSYSYNDDTASQQRHHVLQHGFPPAMDSNYPSPTMPYLHDQGGGGEQHVSRQMAPATSAFDMSSFTDSSMQHMYQPPSSMYNDPTQHGYTDPTYAPYSHHDAIARSNHQVVDRDLHFLAAPSPWQSLHHSTAPSDQASFSLSPPPTSYQDAMPHHPMHAPDAMPSSTMAVPGFAPPSSTRHSSTHPVTSGDHATPYVGLPYSTNPPSHSTNRSLYQPGHPTSFHIGAPSAAAVATASTAEPRSSSVSSTADPLDNKKEKRKSQVRDASRRRRAKRKDEETRLRDRIQELTHQIQIMGGGPNAGGDGARPGPDAPDQDEAALEEAYQQQLQVVHMLQQKNLQYKEKLAQHEQFARLIQTGIHHLTEDSISTAAPQLQLLHQQQLLQLMPRATAAAGALSPAGLTATTGTTPPNLVATPALAALLATAVGSDALTRWAKTASARCHRDLLTPIGESDVGHSTTPNVTTSIAMGWKTQLWMDASPRVVHVRSHKILAGANSPECAEKTWEILTSTAKGRRVYPDLKAIEVVKEVISNELAVALYRKSITHVVDGRDRDTVSVVYKVMDRAGGSTSGKLAFIGVASFDDAALARSLGQNDASDIEPVESYGWSFASFDSVVFRGRYTVQPAETASDSTASQHPDLIMTQFSNETMFALVRWESEAIGPVFRIDQA